MIEADDEREPELLNTDALLQRMELDEITDAPLISPVNYAKIRPIKPQLVYYAIRNGKLKTHHCNCGKRCISREEADAFYRERRGEKEWPWGTHDDKKSADEEVDNSGDRNGN